VASGGPGPAIGNPIATTAPAAPVTATTATLWGSDGDGGQTAAGGSFSTCYFQYGTTTALGSTTTAVDFTGGASATASLTGLHCLHPLLLPRRGRQQCRHGLRANALLRDVAESADPADARRHQFGWADARPRALRPAIQRGRGLGWPDGLQPPAHRRRARRVGVGTVVLDRLSLDRQRDLDQLDRAVGDIPAAFFTPNGAYSWTVATEDSAGQGPFA